MRRTDQHHSPTVRSFEPSKLQIHKNCKFRNIATYVLGIGGLSGKATEDVIELLRAEANLKPNQALADIRIKKTIKTFMAGLIIKRTLTATATIVEFLDSDSNESNGQEPLPIADSSQEYTRDSAYRKLSEIKNSLANGCYEDMSTIVTEVKNIEKWYLKIEPIYSEIDETLKDIREMLNN